MEGWIKLHRKIIAWEWFDDAHTLKLFLYLLAMANHKDGKWQGITVKRGQHITGRKKLAKVLKRSERSIRTSLNKLKTTNEITIQATNRYSTITIVNYNAYNDKETCNDQPNANQASDKRPATDQQTTTNNNDNNDNNDKEVKDMQDFNKVWNTLPARNGKKVEKAASFTRYKQQPLKDRAAILSAATNYANSELVKKGIGIKDPKRFLLNWKDWREAETGASKSTEDNSQSLEAAREALKKKG